MKPLFVLGLACLLPALTAQEATQPDNFEKLLPRQPFVELRIKNPKKLWQDIVKSRMGRVIQAPSMEMLREAWNTSFELRQLYVIISTLTGVDKQAAGELFQILKGVEGDVRLAYFPPLPPPGLGGWILEIEGEKALLARAHKALVTGMGADPVAEEGNVALLGAEHACFKQKAAAWRFVTPFEVEGKLYFAAWQDPDGARLLTGAPGPGNPKGRKMSVRSKLAEQRMDLAVVVDMRDLMAMVQQQYESEGIQRDEFLQFAKLLGVHEIHTMRLGLDIKRGRIVHELRAEVAEGGRFAKFLGSILPREGRAVGLLEFQPKGVRTSAMISLDLPTAYAEFTRLVKEGSREFGGEEIDIEEAGEQFLGISLKEDLIDPLDGRILFFEGDKFVEKEKKKRSGFCLGLGTSKPEKTGETMVKLFEKSGFVKQDESEYKGFTIHNYDFSFLWSKTTIRYAMTGRFFLFGFGAAGHDYLRKVIDSEKLGEEERFRPAGDLKAQLTLVPQESATLVWANTVVAAGSLLEIWAGNLARVTVEDEEVAEDPSAKVLKSLTENLAPLLEKEGLATTLSGLGRDRGGFWIRWIW